MEDFLGFPRVVLATIVLGAAIIAVLFLRSFLVPHKHNKRDGSHRERGDDPTAWMDRDDKAGGAADPARTSVKQIRDLPCPPGLPILGNLVELSQKGYHVCHVEWMQKYGSMFRYKMGPATVVVAADPALVKRMTTLKFRAFHDRPEPPMAAPASNKGLLFARGDYWAGLRAALTPHIFNHSSVHMLYPNMVRCCTSFLDRLAHATGLRPSIHKFVGTREWGAQTTVGTPQTHHVSRQEPKGGAEVGPAASAEVDVLPMMQEATMDAIGMSVFGAQAWGQTMARTGSPLGNPVGTPEARHASMPASVHGLPEANEELGAARGHPGTPEANPGQEHSVSGQGQIKASSGGGVEVVDEVEGSSPGKFGTPEAHQELRPSAIYAELQRLNRLGPGAQLALLLCPDWLRPLLRWMLTWIPGSDFARADRLRETLLKEWERRLKDRRATELGGGGATTRRGSFQEAEDLVVALLRARSKGSEEALSDADLTVALFNLIGAGSETTAVTVACALHFLAAHPGEQERLAAEIQGRKALHVQQAQDAVASQQGIQSQEAVSPGRTVECAPSPADLKEMPFLEAVIQETLRLCPPGALVAREASETTELGGILIPRGAPVLAPVYAMHRNEQWFSSPNQFIPDRFLSERCVEKGALLPEENGGPVNGGQAQVKGSNTPTHGAMACELGAIPDGAYLPFGMGPRMCIGQKFAMIEAGLFLFMIVDRFRVQLPIGGAKDLELAAGINLKPKHGVRLLFCSRLKEHRSEELRDLRPRTEGAR